MDAIVFVLEGSHMVEPDVSDLPLVSALGTHEYAIFPPMKSAPEAFWMFQHPIYLTVRMVLAASFFRPRLRLPTCDKSSCEQGELVKIEPGGNKALTI